MPEIEVAPESVKWHDGWKTFSGLAVVVLPIFAGFLGFDVREMFPAEMARFGEEAIILAGAALAFYGRWKSKVPLWFVKK